MSSPKRGYVKGEPHRFIIGHQTRKSAQDYVEQDCGHVTPCWMWQLSTSGSGYGTTSIPGTRQRRPAHRVMYERLVGPIPEGLDLDHLCRNRLCVNPEHLEPVTRATNLQRGSTTRLTADDARAIRRDTTRSQAQLARDFGVAPNTIRAIKIGRTWRNA